MQRCEVKGCRNEGQRHHIVFRSQGGLDIPLNYKYLCAEHHNMGNRSPHLSREVDVAYKIELQRTFYKLFHAERYTIGEIADLIECQRETLERRFKAVPNCAGTYEKEDIIRALMGGRLY